jgi:hypothetical protein
MAELTIAFEKDDEVKVTKSGLKTVGSQKTVPKGTTGAVLEYHIVWGETAYLVKLDSNGLNGELIKALESQLDNA